MYIITDVQQARAIIGAVGSPAEKTVVDKLQATYYDMPDSDVAHDVLRDIEHKYALATANDLWVNHFDEIPQYIKEYNDEEV